METLKGTLAQIRFQKDGFVIAQIAGGVSIKGNMVSPSVGMEYTLEGEYETHPRFGKTFKFESYETAYPQKEGAIRAYLMENAKWIGPKVSGEIITKYNSKTLEVLKDDPDRVAKEVSGITLQRAQEISAMLRGNEDREKLAIRLNELLDGAGLGKRLTNLLIEKWGKEAPEQIRANPYQLIHLFDGVGFVKADKVALNSGFEKTGAIRIEAAIRHVLNEEIFMSGHTVIPKQKVVDEARKLIGLDRELIEKTGQAMVASQNAYRRIIENGNFWTLPEIHEKEKSIAIKIEQLNSHKLADGTPNFDGLAKDQTEALTKAATSSVFILTGGPGTGKTYTIKKIIEAFDEQRIALAAPTGKAAKRIIEQTGMEAQTIHRLLEPDFNGKTFKFRRNAEIPITADVIILDETSMVDIRIMAQFLDAVASGTRLILVGDTYQLPSVGPGNVLKDLIASGKVPTVELTEIKRQAELGGLIVRNCHKIKDGENIGLENSTAKDFFFLKRDSAEDIASEILKLVKDRLPKSYDADPLKDIQVISPLREKTALSCKAINQKFQKEFNPSPVIEKCSYKVGDKVIQTKNDYTLEIINGDIGYVLAIDNRSKEITVQFENPQRKVDLPMYGNNLDLAYAVTCHKYQGSESKIVVMPIFKQFSPMIMQRNWLYTAISRASNVCILVGHRDEISKIIGRNNQQKRFTRLVEFLMEGNHATTNGTTGD